MPQTYDSATTYDDATKAYDVGFLVTPDAFELITALPVYELPIQLPTYEAITDLPIYELTTPLELDYS